MGAGSGLWILAQGAQAGDEGDDAGAGQHREGALETHCGEEKAAQRRADDLAQVRGGIEAAELHAARAGELARHRPVRRPERGAREDEYKLAGEQHPEALRHHEPQAGGESGYAGAEQDAAPANAVRIGAADEVERGLRHHGGANRMPISAFDSPWEYA